MRNKQITTRSRVASIAGSGLLGGLALLGAGCAAGNAGAHDGHHHVEQPDSGYAYARPEVTFRAGDEVIELPEEVPSGYVDLRVQALDEGDAHLLIGKLADGVSFAEFDAASEADQEAMMSIRGGNGTIHPGDETLLTMQLEPGNWVVLNIYFAGGEVPQFSFGRFVVTESDNVGSAPEERGTIVLGPGMRIDVPDDFDATGVWKFENHDEEQVHEAALVGLAEGATTEDLIDWFADMQGPPPMRGEFGSMGAVGPGQEAWITFAEDDLAPGPYSLICWIPGSDGVPHLMAGMFEDLTIT